MLFNWIYFDVVMRSRRLEKRAGKAKWNGNEREEAS